MSTMKLHNKGKRIIIESGFHFKPGAVVDFPTDVGLKLHRLYKNEVHSLEDATEAFKSGGAVDFVAPEPADKKADKKPAKKDDFESSNVK